MRFFNVDQHIAVISDITHIFGMLGHCVMSHNLSGHAPLVGLPKADIPLLNGDSWCGFWKRDGIEQFTKQYGADVNEYDAVIVTYPPIFARLYDKIDKPIIIQIPIRYEHGVDGDYDGWTEWNEWLKKNVEAKKVYLVANSKYDQKYTEAFTGLPVRYIPSLCEYTWAQYNPAMPYVLYHGSEPTPDIPNLMKKHAALKPGHPWQAVALHRANVWVPYNVSIMSMFEQYSMGMPVFVPSKDLLLDMYANGCEHGALSQYSWSKTYDRPGGSQIDPGVYDPNDINDLEAINWWLVWSDFYNSDFFPEIMQFPSWDALREQITAPDFKHRMLNVSYRMRLDQQRRRATIVNRWVELLDTVKKDWGIS